ncbi:type VI secretion-associated protein, BMA_A0400 family [Pseudomonas delhiensis]|uniref:Type VI secretion-associated protein, BMA_A0400 family n=1 Tax=Pseudomonas delhiensis TaxID=366289 RepID=A0A239IA03_9PSED|nr:type VI secretion system-associated protein TagF [Pseudomonas delhiensis]SDK16107.1 type VI secretion-associated protein, BMA_A0400 family [Pseudomonas delhiensis]SNS90369.1 type VI secretion-associated protein, BMA_A0400 family [Pseudomonas delhiensis]
MIRVESLMGDIGWYGKIPSAGDFVGRRLAPELEDSWVDWCDAGLLRLRQDGHGFAAEQRLWNFVLPLQRPRPQLLIGCLLAGSDRVGRRYPLCALRSCTAMDWARLSPAVLAAWFARLGSLLRQGLHERWAVEALDHALLTLDSRQEAAAALPALGECIAGGASSYWWRWLDDGPGVDLLHHCGEPDVALFIRLFGNAGEGDRP